MGQTESRKFIKRNKKSLVFPKASPGFMETFPKNNSEGETNGKNKDGTVPKKATQTKGVAMSFGFRKRPVSGPASISTDIKKQEEKHVLPKRTIIKKEPVIEREEVSSVTPKQNDIKVDAKRFGFRGNKPQNQVRFDITTKDESGSSYQPTRTSIEQTASLSKARNVNRIEFLYGTAKTNTQPQQLGKYTLQSTELPQLEPVRVIESKIEKTIINTRRKSANNKQQQERSLNSDNLLTNTTTFSTKNNNEINYKKYDELPINRSYASHVGRRMEERFNNNTQFEEKEKTTTKVSNNYNKAHERPTTWRNEASTGKEKHDKPRTGFGHDSFYEPDLQKNFFKMKLEEIAKNDNQVELWDNAGEAMALDLSEIEKIKKKPKYNNTVTAAPTSLFHSPLSSSPRTSSPLNLLPTVKSPDSTLLNEDLGFVASVTASSNGMLLDDEILSPIESFSISEADPNTKSSLYKDTNDKSPDSTPPSPTNISSMSLVEEKDFLIDDEIADQPGLTFKHTEKDERSSNSSIKYKCEEPLRNQLFKNQKKMKSMESSPMKGRRAVTKSTGSLDSLSSCESLCSSDFIMDYDSSHANEVNDLQRSLSKLSEKIALSNDRNSTDSPWLERELGYPSYTSNLSDSRNLDSINYNCNTTFSTLNFNSKPTSPTLQKDVRNIKKMLIKLKMVLNDTDTQNPFRDTILDNDDHYFEDQSDRLNENVDNGNVIEKELADLRRQVLFLQVQLENKEETVTSLQKKVTDLSVQTNNAIAPPEPDNIETELRKHCNAATQTKRVNV
ncbi:putative uncharacterized protein DDB_G0291812 isoform X2 [Sitophilus oryzae]|uniref:Uncharacterized protein n=1 Tax=Sitophilus oryzae TaxID=7048 RepID=A0A6J2YHQ5_SITOR|nr:putative uncharacterized protein DDB_G0291812 isoform X2 [Sitophilus oryzae]